MSLRGRIAPLGAALVLLAAGCGAAPKPLRGLWSSSAAACTAGLGVQFRGDKVQARFQNDAFVLLAQPRYDLEETPEGALVRITYALPAAPGEAADALGRGVIELKWSRADGRLFPLSRRFVDLRTGAATVPLKADAIDRALALMRCPKRPSTDTGGRGV